MSKRRTHSPEFKARVAMEAISGRKTIQEIAADHAIHPIQVSQWKKQLLEGASELFTSGKKSKDKEEGQARMQSCSRRSGGCRWSWSGSKKSLSCSDAHELRKLVDQDHPELSVSRHFSVDGTLLQAWASHASLERIDGKEDPPPPPSGPGEGFGAPKPDRTRAKGDFRGIKFSNKTHRSSLDPDALVCRKSNAHPALPSFRGHVLMDNRHALIVDCKVTQATGTSAAAALRAAQRAINSGDPGVALDRLESLPSIARTAPVLRLQGLCLLLLDRLDDAQALAVAAQSPPLLSLRLAPDRRPGLAPRGPLVGAVVMP